MMVAYSFKRRFVNPIRVGLSRVSLSFDCPPKRQTIRGIGKRRHARPGEIVQLYYAMRTRQCEKIGEARCTDVQNILIFVAADRIIIGDNPAICIPAGLDTFAKSDGFADWYDMREFWREEHGDLTRLGPFVGVLIEWEP